VPLGGSWVALLGHNRAVRTDKGHIMDILGTDKGPIRTYSGTAPCAYQDISGTY